MAKSTKTNSELVADLVVKGMQEIKAHDITKIDLRDLDVAVADYFVICHGDSDRQVIAIGESVEDEVKKGASEKPFSREGKQTGDWVLLDYANVVVHIFRKDIREFYNLEALWSDGKVEQFEDVL